jgi:aldehyde dehydrogenase (NAD+)
MGGKNPLVVLDDADLDRAVMCAIDGAFFSTGQRCTASSRIIVTEGIHDRFVEAMAEKAKSLRVGDALDPNTQIGPAVSEDQLEQNLRYVRIAREEGGKVLTGGEEPLKLDQRGYYMAPTPCDPVKESPSISG